jgi:hypothetical protein
MFFGRPPEGSHPARRGLGLARFGVTLAFLFAMVFASGVEATGLHHHDTAGSHPNCAICRVVAGRVDSVPRTVVPISQGLPEVPGELSWVVEPSAPAPHLVHIRLRAPPTT